MAVRTRSSLGKVDVLPKGIGSLTSGHPPAQTGTLFVMGTNGGMRVAPDAGFDVVFGRCEPDVHVCVGANDPHVSRRHGYITREHSRWVLYNVGKLAIRFPGSRLVLGGHRAELPAAYTPLFIVTPEQEHLLEVRIAAGAAGRGAGSRHDVDTYDPGGWELSDLERLVLVCLGQRYLRQEPWPQPLTWAQVADELGALRPGERWNAKRAARIVTEVRRRLSARVDGLLEEDVPPPLGNTLNHNLISELLVSATIVTADLALLDGPDGLA
ncbi:FHA domain-containing protein [Actinomadura sp. NPDC048394]|uniref:FHA domain-containing protein n=1 Tax=Actinomadura sp. NPDC048394 TaxID=3158223 RepID=UPI0033CE05F9